ncbi:MAG: YaaL family protein [Clostridium sp.]|nr:YaaL family protein [Clostridium sp.]
MTNKKGPIIANSISYNFDKNEIIKAIEEARKELQQCQDYFQIVDEPVLVDYAIYKEAAAKMKYVYLIGQAKKFNIKAQDFDIHDDEENAE